MPFLLTWEIFCKILIVILFPNFHTQSAVSLMIHCLRYSQVQLRRLEKGGELEAKASGVATQTGSGRVLSSESMKKLKV